MKIKRYTAPSMRAALAQVRAEQGDDAVILSSRRGEEGIEVIAAVDYDEALFADANRQRSASTVMVSPAMVESPPIPAAPTAAASSGRPAAAPARASTAETAFTPAQASPTPAPESSSSRAPALARTGAVSATSPSAPPRTAAAYAAQRSAMRSPTVGAPTSAAGATATADAGATPRTTVRSPTARAPISAAGTSASTAAATQPSARVHMPPRGASVAPRAPLPRPDAGYMAMTRELQDMRQLLETGLAGMTWNDKRLREPLRARVLEELSAMDIAPDVAETLAAMTPRRTSLDDPSHIPLALLVKHLPVIENLGSIAGGIMAVVGPTGAGKTTTIAKLAARWCLQHGNQDLALVSTDCYRIGAREQLMTYGRILGVPTYAANGGMELGRVLGRLKSKKMILIDTAGMGPRDVRLTEQLAALKLGAARATVLLALPAQGEGHALDEICRAYARAAPAACIITKVDEAASLGAVMSAILRHQLKIAYICDGQQVPDDLHAAHRKRVWLVRAALKLKEDRGSPARDAAYLARNFGRAIAHA